MSSLFKKKEKPVPIPVLEEQPVEYSLESIHRRIFLLVKAEKKVHTRLSQFEESIHGLQQHSISTLREVNREMQEIKKQYKDILYSFHGLIKGVSYTAKKEDVEKTKRFLDQYDFAEMITRDEFEKQVGE